jgi:cytochrome c peroxidase
MLYKKVLILLLCVISFALAACNLMEERENWVITSESYEDLDNLLAKVIENQGLSVLDMNQIPDNDLIQLGQALFFDKILSGNQDISCASCHHPAFSGGDALPIAIGTGGSGLGSNRKLGQDRNLIPRNSPEIFNRGASDWESMFWDSRVAVALDGVFISPAAEELPEGLNSVLSVQAMFPVTSRDEMRGYISDGDNELSLINDDDLPAIWQAIMSRLLSNPKYVQLFSAAYPDVPTNELGFQHAANAIAAFEIASFTFADSPWDRYLAGDHGVLSDNAKQGALLFYGEAGCSQCHSGSLMSDQEHHNICVPQLGPGKDESGLDYGRYLETGDPQDKFAFRTPPLRNVALTGPWMHNGAYTRLEDAVRHHFNAAEYLADYTGEHLPEQFKQTLQNDAELIAEIMATLDPLLVSEPEISSEEFDQLMAFLLAQTSPSALNLAYLVPDTVPSGLPIRE